MLFSTFCCRSASDGLFNRPFELAWIHSPANTGLDFVVEDDFSMYCMGGEL